MSGATSIEGVVVVKLEEVRPATFLSEAVGTARVMIISLHDDVFGILAGVR